MPTNLPSMPPKRDLIAIAGLVVVAGLLVFYFNPPVCKKGDALLLVGGQPTAGCPAAERPVTEFNVF